MCISRTPTPLLEFRACHQYMCANEQRSGRWQVVHQFCRTSGIHRRLSSAYIILFRFFFIPSILRKVHDRIKQLRSKTDIVMQRKITVMSMDLLQSSKWYMYFYCLILFSLIKKITIPFQTNCKWRIRVWSFINLKHYIIFFYLLPVYQKYSKKRMSVKIILLWYYAIHDFIMVIKYYAMKISFHKIS